MALGPCMMFDKNNPQIEAVLNICNGTSTKYVPAPSRRSIQADLLIGLRQFKNSVRWKEFWIRNKNVDMEETSSEEEEEEFVKEGLGTQLKPKSKGAFRGSEDLENFFTQLERELLSVGWDNEMPRRCNKNWDINETIRLLEESYQVIVPTDKTNSFRNMDM